MALITQILETCLYVDDMGKAGEFYSKLFEIETYSKAGERHLFFKIGKSMLLLFNPEKTKTGGEVPAHGASGAGHVAFTIGHDDLDFWRKRLSQQNIEIELEYTWSSGGRSIYFRDPFNNSIELATADTWA